MRNRFMHFIHENKKEIIVAFLTLIVSFLCFLGMKIYTISTNAVNSLKDPIEIVESYASSLDNFEYSELQNDEYDWQFTEGCVLNTYVKNLINDNVAISKYKLVIDNIESAEISNADIFAYSSNNQLYLYVVNNGNNILTNAKVQISAFYYNNGDPNPNETNQLSKILNTETTNCIFDIPEIEPGRIFRFATFDFNIDAYREYQESLGNSTLQIYTNTFFDNDINISYNYLGYLEERENVLNIISAVGGTTYPIKREVIVDSTKKAPFDINLKTEFQIDAYNTELLKTVLFVEKTCKITFHIELKVAGDNYIKSEPMTQEILVPIYNIENEATTIREWVINNNIVDYHYNENLQLQEDIIYKITEEYSPNRY